MRSDERGDHGSSAQNRYGWLVHVALSFIAVIFGSRYLWFSVAVLAQGILAMPALRWLSRLQHGVPLIVLRLLLYPIDLLFTSLTVYLVLSATGLILGIATIALARPRKLSLALVLLGLLAMTALPFV